MAAKAQDEQKPEAQAHDETLEVSKVEPIQHGVETYFLLALITVVGVGLLLMYLASM